MSRIVDGLLALARYEAGIDVPAVEPVDAAALARAQCGAARPRADTRGIALDEQIDAELWLITDPLLFERILANLIGNAVDHAPDGSLVEVFCRAQDDDVSLVISNAAPGLTPEDVAQLGERHFRAPGGAPAPGHAGLGLALCLALAAPLGIRLGFDLENGRLWVRLAGLRTLDSAL
jgi:signal transduction histidine kinase